MHLLLDRHASPIGTILTITDAEGYLCALDFQDYEPRMARLLRRHYGDYTLADGPRDRRVATALAAYFELCAPTLGELAVRTGGTDFQRAVWAQLRTIPAGATVSYGELARRLGRPRASRAVGLANGGNPVAIAVPCHRLVGSDGALTGYGGGLHRKEWLLAHERRWAQK